MQQTQLYQFAYLDCLRHGGLRLADLSASLHALIMQAERVSKMLGRSDAQIQEQLLFTIAGADAVICDGICKQYPEKTAAWQPILPEDSVDVNKTLLIALRAKALRLKWSNRNHEN